MEAWIGSIMVVPFNFAPQGWAMCAGQLLAVNQNQALFSLISNLYGGDAITNFAVPDLRGRCAVGAFAPGPNTPAASYPLAQAGGAVTASFSQVPQHSHASALTLSMSGANASGPVNLPVSASFNDQPLSVTGSMQASTEAASADAPFEGATMADLSPGTSPRIYGSPSTNPSKQVKLAPITSTGKLSATSTGTVTGSLSLPVTGTPSGTVTVQPAGVPQVTVPTVAPYLALNTVICLNGIYPSRP